MSIAAITGTAGKELSLADRVNQLSIRIEELRAVNAEQGRCITEIARFVGVTLSDEGLNAQRPRGPGAPPPEGVGMVAANPPSYGPLS